MHRDIYAERMASVALLRASNRTRRQRVRDAWVLLSSLDWSAQSPQWRADVLRWRDRYSDLLEEGS